MPFFLFTPNYMDTLLVLSPRHGTPENGPIVFEKMTRNATCSSISGGLNETVGPNSEEVRTKLAINSSVFTVQPLDLRDQARTDPTILRDKHYRTMIWLADF